MPAPATVTEFVELVRKSGVIDEKRLDAHLDKLRAASALPVEPVSLAGALVRDGVLTNFQATQLMQGKWRRFIIGKYKVLEHLGSGGMGMVYLCEHTLIHRRVAVKVLPVNKAEDPASLERFYREARAVAALDHPHIVRAYDIDHAENLHFLVMEYVDGSSLQEIVRRTGPMDVTRACHYIRQAALGLQHAHAAASLIHRDIKPSNILLDRNGIVRIVDMGLARFFGENEILAGFSHQMADFTGHTAGLTGSTMLGTLDYIAPEQTRNSSDVDIRADIYSLGCTFFFLLAGRPPFGEGTMAQTIVWHQTRPPPSIRDWRSDVPPSIAAIIQKMMAKDPGQRFQAPLEVAGALAPWTNSEIAPPPAMEMPRLSLAATTGSSGTTGSDTNDATPRLDTEGSADSSLARINRAREDTSARRRLIPILSIGGGVAVVLVGLVLWLALRGKSGGSGKPSKGEQSPAILTVGPDGDYRTVAEALQNANSGDRIVVQAETLREPAAQFPPEKLKHLKRISVEAADPKKKARWQLPPSTSGKWLFQLEEADGWRFKGFVFDGGDRLETLGYLIRCRGVTLEDIELRGFLKKGLHFINCAAPPESPITLSHVSANSSVPPLVFEVSRHYEGPLRNSNITVEKDCRFGGGKVQKRDIKGGENAGVEVFSDAPVETTISEKK